MKLPPFNAIARSATRWAAGGAVSALVALPAHPLPTALVDYEINPALAQGPSVYVAVPAVQVIHSIPAVFNGGVVLGLATFFPAIAFASAPNVYGTANFGNNLGRTLSIDINPSFLANEVSFALFNGETFSQSYTVRAFDGATEVATQTLVNVAPNFNSGYGLIDVKAPNITRVTIDADGAPAAFDFLIDDVAFNQSINQAVPNLPTVPVPQPSTAPVEVQLDNLDVVVLDDQGQRQKRKQKGKGLVQLNAFDDINHIRGEVLLITLTTPVPEPESWVLMLAGIAGLGMYKSQRRAR